jgi:hypothetical protein
MPIPSIELQKSLFSALSSGDYKVYEIVPSYASFPYITIDNETILTDDTKTNLRYVITKTISTWSIGSGSSQGKTMNDFVIQQLLRNDLVVNGFFVDFVSLELLTTQVDKDETIDENIFHGIIQIEFTLMEVE